MLPDAFADAFSYGSAALVIGSGIASARPFSAPSWRSVVSTTLDGVATGLLLKVSDRELSGRLSQTIQSLRAHSVHTEHIVGAMIETVGVERAAEMAAIGTPEPNAHHLALAHCVRTLNIPVTITVDFSDVYERALERVGVPFTRITRNEQIAQYLQHQLAAPDHLVIKIAGALDDTRSLKEAFGEDIPAATLGRSRPRTLSQTRLNLLETLPSTYRVLALGVDNYDPYAADVIAQLLRSANPDRVAIQMAPTEQALTRLLTAEMLQATRIQASVADVLAMLVEVAAASTPDDSPPDLSAQIGQPLEFVARLLERMGDFEAAHAFFTAIFKNGSPQVAVDISSSTLITIGQLAQRHGDLDSALSHYDSALAAAERSNDPEGVAQALMHRGRACRAKRDHDGALKSFALALDLALEHEFDEIRASALHELADVHERQGDLQRSIVRIRQLADLYEHRGDRRNLGRVMLRLGNDLRRTGELQHAAETFDYVLALADEAADRALAAWADCHLVDTKLAEGQWPHDEQLRRSLVVFEVSGERKGVAFASLNLARLCALLGDLAQARQYLDRALRTSQETLDSAAMCPAYVELAQIDALLGDRAATSLLERGVGLARELDDKTLARRVFLTAGFALLHLRELEKVGPVLGEARVLATVDGDEIMEAQVLHGLGMRSGLARDVATAERRFRRAAELFHRLQMPAAEASAREWLAHMYAIASRREDAQQQLEAAAELARQADDGERANALSAYATRLLEDAPVVVPVVPLVVGRHLRHLHVVPADDDQREAPTSTNTGLSGVTAFALSTPTSMVPVAPVMSANEGEYERSGEAYAMPLDSEQPLDSTSIHDAATFASGESVDLVPVASRHGAAPGAGSKAGEPFDVPADLRNDNSVSGTGAAYISDEHAAPREEQHARADNAVTDTAGGGDSAFPIVPMDTAENAAIEAAAREAVHDRTQIRHAQSAGHASPMPSDRARFVASHEALSDGDADDAASRASQLEDRSPVTSAHRAPSSSQLRPPSSMSPPSLSAVPASSSPSSSSLVSTSESKSTAIVTDRSDIADVKAKEDLTDSRRFEMTGVRSSSTSGRRKAPMVPRNDGDTRAPSSQEVSATRPPSSQDLSATRAPSSQDVAIARPPSSPAVEVTSADSTSEIETNAFSVSASPDHHADNPPPSAAPAAPALQPDERRDETLEVPIRFDISTGAWAEALDAMPTLASRDTTTPASFDASELAVAPTIPDIPSVTELSAMDEVEGSAAGAPAVAPESALPAAWSSTPDTALPATPPPELPDGAPKDPSESDIFGHESVTNASTGPGPVDTMPAASSNHMPALGAPSAPFAVPPSVQEAVPFQPGVADAYAHPSSPPPLPPVPSMPPVVVAVDADRAAEPIEPAYIAADGGGNGSSAHRAELPDGGADTGSTSDPDSRAVKRMLESSGELPVVRPSQTTLPMPDFAGAPAPASLPAPGTLAPPDAISAHREPSRVAAAGALPSPASVAAAPARHVTPPSSRQQAVGANDTTSSRSASPKTKLAAPPARPAPAGSTRRSAAGPAIPASPLAAATPESTAPAPQPSPEAYAAERGVVPDTQALPASQSTRTNPPKGLLPPPPRHR